MGESKLDEIGADVAREPIARFLELDWPDAVRVSALLGVPIEALTTMRHAGVLLGAWSQPAGKFVYPSFQLLNGTLAPMLSDLLAVLATDPEFSPDRDRGGWRRVFYLYGSSAYAYDPASDTAGLSTVEAFLIDPRETIKTLRRDLAPTREWDGFFNVTETASDDFMREHPSQLLPGGKDGLDN